MARLPVPGSDDGSWGDVLNTFLGVAHNSDGTLKDAALIAGAVQSSTVTAKGDVLVASGAGAVTRLPVGATGRVLVADSSQANGLAWATLSRDTYPISAYGFHSASCDTLAVNSSTLSGAFFARVFVPAGNAITALAAVVHTAGTSSGTALNGFAVYDDTGNLVASTTSDNTVWTATGWAVRTLASPIAAQTADRFVYVGAACNGYSAAPYIEYLVTDPTFADGGGYLVNHRRAFYIGSLGSWPASIDPATYGSAAGGYIPFFALG